MKAPGNTVLDQIDAALARHDKLRGDHDDYTHLSRADVVELVGRLSSTIEALTPEGHRYRKMTAVTLKTHGVESAQNLEALVGVLRALRADLEGGYLRRWEEMVRADLFSNFLDIARHFLSEGFLDAAAVMAGGALEQHLRNLCVKEGVFGATDAELHRFSLYDLREKLFTERHINATDNRFIKNWAKVRNRAAHRNDPEIQPPEVKLMIDGIEHFIRTHPA